MKTLTGCQNLFLDTPFKRTTQGSSQSESQRRRWTKDWISETHWNWIRTLVLDQSLWLWLASCSFNGIAWCWKLWAWRLKWTDVTWCCRVWFVLPKGKRMENTPKNMPISHLSTEAAGKSVVRYWGQAPRGGNSTWVTVTFLSCFLYHHFLLWIQFTRWEVGHLQRPKAGDKQNGGAWGVGLGLIKRNFGLSKLGE